ncbi:polysaccharide biosynthesis/export family protein [Candidatus Parabeggiatoa sp. HSG14]|uniref:polysaccharide biosynthesis/export family protein n=1 Tax=Candidatus Parabeggiatoa sp. HSG14 TaxID=3055593 RepID=UPI0025A91F62|nr:polysaccharide biosynthesis/export family protein [Thiotrichales bacterium HSG14]
MLNRCLLVTLVNRLTTLHKYSLYLSLPIKLGVLMGFIMACSPSVIHLPETFLQPVTREEITVTKPDSLAKFQKVVKDEENYLLGTGDGITVEVWGYPELSGKHVIGPDGRITLPLVGPLQMTQLSREQAAQIITTKLSLFYIDLSVAVRIDNYASNRVLVLGRVAHPGEVPFGMTTPTLLEAISLAGGFSEASGLEGAQSLPFTHCAVFRGRDQVVWIELEPLLTGKDLSLNLNLQRNDIVYVPEIEEKLVYVLGEVRSPGAFRLTPNMSFLEILAKAGGPTRDAAPSKINVIRPKEGINQSLALDDLITPNEKMNVALQEGDIIYVPTNTIAKINYAIQILNPFTTMLNIYSDIESIRADTQRRRLDKEEEDLRADKAAIEAEKAALEAKIEAEKAAIEAEKAANSGFE